MALEREQDTYQANLTRLMEHEGRYVVIRRDEIEGHYDTYDHALEAGYERFGLTPFMIKRIRAYEQVHRIG